MCKLIKNMSILYMVFLNIIFFINRITYCKGGGKEYMNILILDDDSFWLDTIYERLSYYALMTNHDYHFYKCSNIEDVKHIFKDVEISVIISDIETEDKNNNIHFIKKLSKKHNTIIIFVTNYDEYALQSFGLNVYKYILKSDFENQAKEIIDFIEEYFFKSSEIVLDTHSGKISLQYRDIFYIECFGHNLYLYTVKTKFQLKKMTIKHLHNILPDVFVLISRNIIVNVINIQVIDNDEILLKNNKRLYISRRRKREVYEKYCKNLEIKIK